MASEFSFDVVSKVDITAVEEALANAQREIANRYDFKGSDSKLEFDGKNNRIILNSSDEYKVKALYDVLLGKLAKRGAPLKNFIPQKIENALGGRARQAVIVQQGLTQEKAKEIVKAVKDQKFKVNSSIKGDTVRIASKSKNELQAVISFLKEKDFGVSLQFVNYR